ncbi:hypothetical protein CRG98_050124 [Punica granatum]|nr:hypothetical protein CRG98_050124 [Punica granatum]
MADYARNLLNKQMDLLEKLESIDAIQQLGLRYHFEREIKHALNSLYESAATGRPQYDDLHSTALRFRIFRQHYYYEVPQDVFRKFIDETGNFRATLTDDVKGLLSLYEASFHGFKGEDIFFDSL